MVYISEMRLIILILLFNVCVDSYSQDNLPLQEVLFTDADKLEKGEQDRVILNEIVKLISSVEEQEEIYVCMFKLSDPQILSALIDANDRGVNVNIILNKGETSRDDNKATAERLKKELNNFFYISNTVAENSIIHNKFILFSEVELEGKSYDNLVLQTSSNMTVKDSKKIQDMVILNDPETYYCYRDYWYEIKVLGLKNDLEKYSFSKCENESKSSKVYLYPKRKKGEAYGKDDIEKILENIEDPNSAEIYFLHAKWDKNRDNLLDELDNLQEKGAKITVVANENIDKKIEETLKDSDTRFVLIDHDDLSIHSKIILISDKGNKNGNYRVLTGSHNLTEKSLEKNFEVLLEIRSKDLFTDYQQYIENVIRVGLN